MLLATLLFLEMSMLKLVALILFLYLINLLTLLSSAHSWNTSAG